jgi:FAD synthase
VSRLRDEQQFFSREALQEAIKKDIAVARTVL